MADENTEHNEASSEYNDGYEQGSSDTASDIVKRMTERLDALIQSKQREIEIARAEFDLLIDEKHRLEIDFKPN